MPLSRKSFRAAAEWAATYQPVRRKAGGPIHAGGTLFGLGKSDQSFLLTVDREFIWTVFSASSIEYIVAGKRKGANVLGYLVTDNPVLLREVNRRWAIDYERIDWDEWERQGQEANKDAPSGNATSRTPSGEPTAPDPSDGHAKRNPGGITAPLHKAFERAASAVLDHLAATVTPTARKTGFEEIQREAKPAPSARPAAEPSISASAPIAFSETVPSATPLIPPPPAPAKKRAPRAKKPARHIEEPPAPNLPFPEPATAETLPPKPVPAVAYPKPPRPKPRPRPVLPLPPSLPPPIPSGPDPLPTPPAPRPKLIKVDLATLPEKEIAIPLSAPPPTTANPDPLPTPAPPPMPRRFRTRTLPIGASAAQLDQDVFGAWPGAVRCQRCHASGFVREEHSGLAACEACDGRGWNPPQDSPLELKVWLD